MNTDIRTEILKLTLNMGCAKLNEIYLDGREVSLPSHTCRFSAAQYSI